MDTLTNGSELLAEYADDRAGGERVALRCTLRNATEHLLTLEPEPGVAAPVTGTIVDLTIRGRRYRSTVQRCEPSMFTLLRPRELEELHRHDASTQGGMWAD